MSITELLNIKYPIFQGAMAQISHYQLAAAVSEAGGLGIIASGGMTGEQLREEIRELRKLTDKPFAVNVMLMMKNIKDIVTVTLKKSSCRNDWGWYTKIHHALSERGRYQGNPCYCQCQTRAKNARAWS